MEAQIHEVYTAVARFLHSHLIAMEAATAWRPINDPPIRQFLIEAFHGAPPSVILLTKQVNQEPVWNRHTAALLEETL